MKILLFVLSALLFSIVESQIFRTIRFVPIPYQGPRIFRGSSPAFNIGRSRWSWGRCFDYPWIPACQRLFRRPRPNWPQPNSRSQTLPPQNIWPQQQPINRQPPRRIPQQPGPGNVPFQAQTGFVPDITHIQPVCNITCAPGLLLYGGECHLGLDSLCTPSCPNGYICHHGHCDIAPCNVSMMYHGLLIIKLYHRSFFYVKTAYNGDVPNFGYIFCRVMDQNSNNLSLKIY
ncbi:uncharacterized protein [Magallana gigas]|uniref:uncharacterized protein isoform X2 n=1 Tax=Magallana gigas TaxID=29159 RepID=UPI003341F300